MCKVYTAHCRICKVICSRNTEHCKDYNHCGDPSKFYRYTSRQCPACEAKDQEHFRQKQEKKEADAAKKKSGVGRLQLIEVEVARSLALTEDPIIPSNSGSSSRLEIGQTTQINAVLSHGELLQSEERFSRRRSRTIRPDTVRVETYSPPPSPKCIPVLDPGGWYTPVVPETPAAFEQLFKLVNPGWDGISERKKRMDAEKNRRA